MPDQIPYDEMRRILGLPDVRVDVLAMRTEIVLDGVIAFITSSLGLSTPLQWQRAWLRPIVRDAAAQALASQR